MLRSSALVAALLVITLAACDAGPAASPGDETGGVSGGPGRAAAPADDPTPALVQDGGSSFGAPHPDFAAHFTDPLYADAGGEFAPFGTDEGWDVMVSWSARRDELPLCTSVRDLLADEQVEGTALDHPEQNGPDVDAEIIAAGFGLVYLTGRLDAEGKQATLSALRRTDAVYPDVPELARMTRDLESFPAEDTCPR